MDTWNRLAHLITHHAGSKHAFGVALALVLIWVGIGIGAGSTRAWELVVTCGVPIVTLLMVIVLQHTQNRDAQALQIKLNELLLALEEPDDQIIHAGRLGDNPADELGVGGAGIDLRQLPDGDADDRRVGGPEQRLRLVHLHDEQLLAVGSSVTSTCPPNRACASKASRTNPLLPMRDLCAAT